MTLQLLTSQIIFYIFAILALVGAFGVISFRNAVSSAMSMALCFVSVAAIYFGMGAEFMGIVQIIVYAGAILVLFLFVVMMLDVKEEEKKRPHLCVALVGTIVAGVFSGLVANIALSLPGAKDAPCPCVLVCEAFRADSDKTKCASVAEQAAFGGKLPELNRGGKSDVTLLGETLYSDYNQQIVILSFALLAACVGSIAITRKLRKD